jgi:hypothetical protein
VSSILICHLLMKDDHLDGRHLSPVLASGALEEVEESIELMACGIATWNLQMVEGVEERLDIRSSRTRLRR